MKITKKIAALLLSVGMIAAFAGCGGQQVSIGADSTPQSSQQSQSVQESTQIANPWIEAKDQTDAQEQAGFSIQLPSSLPAEYGAPSFRVIPEEILEADYAGSGDATITVRKAAGSDDPSGDYNQYSDSKQVTVGTMEVTMKGNDGAVSLAVWQDGTNSYSIGIYDAAGITVEEMTQMVSEMMG